MLGAGAGDTQVHRIAGAVRDAIIAKSDRLTVARGKVKVSIFDVQGAPRIELTSTDCILPNIAATRGQPTGSHLPDEIRQMANEVRRGLIAYDVQLMAASRVDIEIHMRGARPDIEFIFRYRQP